MCRLRRPLFTLLVHLLNHNGNFFLHVVAIVGGSSDSLRLFKLVDVRLAVPLVGEEKLFVL